MYLDSGNIHMFMNTQNLNIFMRNTESNKTFKDTQSAYLHSAASSGRWCGGQRPLSAGSGRAN